MPYWNFRVNKLEEGFTTVNFKGILLMRWANVVVGKSTANVVINYLNIQLQ
jgi:hypothetical protein